MATMWKIWIPGDEIENAFVARRGHNRYWSDGVMEYWSVGMLGKWIWYASINFYQYAITPALQYSSFWRC
jgi:hypothetical protein